MTYFYKHIEYDKDGEEVVYAASNNIDLKNMPKKYKDKEILSFIIEKINDKV